MNITLFLIVGSIVGLLGAVFHEARGFQIIANFGSGLAGALIGGFIFKAHPLESFAFWGTVGMAAFISGVFIFIYGFFSKHSRNLPIKTQT